MVSNIVKTRINAPRAYQLLKFLHGRLLDAGVHLIFRKLRNIIIFCMQVGGASKILSG